MHIVWLICQFKLFSDVAYKHLIMLYEYEHLLPPPFTTLSLLYSYSMYGSVNTHSLPIKVFTLYLLFVICCRRRSCSSFCNHQVDFLWKVYCVYLLVCKFLIVKAIVILHLALKYSSSKLINVLVYTISQSLVILIKSITFNILIINKYIKRSVELKKKSSLCYPNYISDLWPSNMGRRF